MEKPTSGVGRLLAERRATILVILLLAATAAAFVRAEDQKLEPSVIETVEVDPRLISPTCRCETASVSIEVELRRPSAVTVAIVNEEGDVVRDLAVRETPLEHVSTRWDGRDDAGNVVPDGRYRPQLRVVRDGRTFLLANRVEVDTRPPRATVVSALPEVLTPDGDGRSDRVEVVYRLSERAQPLLFVNGIVRVRGYSRRREGKLNWYGRRRGRALPPGKYELQLAARDAAGNLGPLGRPVTIRVR